MGKQFKRPYLEKPYHKKMASGVTPGEGPEFNPQLKKKNSLCQKV
jgi:hypothetical protein